MGEEAFIVGGRKSRVFFTPESPELREDGNRLHVFDEGTVGLFPAPPDNSVVLPRGERSKEWAGVEVILDAAFSRGMARDSVFVGVGGGMVCDVTAFAASLFMRGAGLELIPTSLLAMADAAFGGKTAVNFRGRKNMVGTFYPAQKILVSSAFLPRLPQREYLSGLAEVLKSGMLGDPELFSLLARRGGDLLSSASREDRGLNLELSRRSLLVKASFVVRDPTEKGIRAHLNLGHTFAHGLEAATGFSRFTHGETVAWGILRALDAGLRLGLTDTGYAEEVRALIEGLGYPVRAPGISAESVLRAMEGDKKKKGGRVRFVLQKKPGDTFMMPLERELIEAVVEAGLTP